MKKWRLATTSQLLKANKKKIEQRCEKQLDCGESMGCILSIYRKKKMRLHHVLVGLTS